MRFPAGTDGGSFTGPLDEDVSRTLEDFTGAIEVETPEGHGFILAGHGAFVSAYFRTGDGELRGKEALPSLSLDNGKVSEERVVSLRAYTPEEFRRAVGISGEERLFLPGSAPAGMEDASPASRPGGQHPGGRPAPATIPQLAGDSRFEKLLAQPGVIAVSAFFEGFAVQSLGNGDFERVAAAAEDFMRAGTKIAREMGIGEPGQLILETESNKVIIAPCGDLSLCILTTADAQLGLIRVVLSTIMREITR